MLRTLDRLEWAFTKDLVSAAEYTTVCSKMIAQYKLAAAAMGDAWHLDSFATEYQLNAPRAVRRLAVGVPATTEFRTAQSSSVDAKQVAETVQNFITLMDSLKLDMTAVDQLHPLLQDLVEAVAKCGGFLPVEYNPHAQKLQSWFTRVNAMRATENLDGDQVRQLSFDLDASYAAFHKALRP
jgi:ESCRT-I complex subunit VPS28